MGKKWWEKRNACVVARIYIVGSLVVVKRGVRVRCNCNIFNLAMENVLKDKISCPDIIHKWTSNVHIFLITFKLRDCGDDIGFLYTWKRCRAVLQCLTPAHKVFRDRMTKKWMQFHVSFLSEADEMHTRKWRHPSL